MSRSRRKQVHRKIELVSLIDVIFLLLIFFMVTMNVIPALTRDQPTEARVDIRIPEGELDIVDRIIQVQQIPEDGSVRYLIFDKNTLPIDMTQDEWQERLQNLTEDALAAMDSPLDALAGLGVTVHGNVNNLQLAPSDEIIISCPDLLPYVEMMKVIRRCRQLEVQNVRLAKYTLSQLARKISWESRGCYRIKYPRS